MRRAMGFACVFVVIGCGNKGPAASSSASASIASSAKAAPSASASAAAALAMPALPTTPLQATFGSKLLAMKTAIVKRTRNELWVIASTNEKMTCDDQSGDAPGISFNVPPSADGTYYAGKVIPLGFSIDSLKDPDLGDLRLVTPSYSRVMIAAPFTLDSPTLKLSVEFDQTREVLNPKKATVDQKGGGTIEAKMCLSDSAKKELAAAPKPPASVDGAVTGAVAGKPWEVKKVFAWLYHDDLAKRDVVSEITFSDNADGTCEMGQKTIFEMGGIAGNQFLLSNPGISDKEQPVGYDFPVDVTAENIAPGSMHGTGVTAVSGTLNLSKVELKEGGTIEGRVWMDTGPKPDDKDSEGKLAGTFKATVCKRGW